MGASTASTFSSKRFRRLLGASLLAGLAITASASAQSRGPRRDEVEPQVRRGAPAARATVFFCENSNVSCRTGINDFKVDDLRDLYVFVAWGNNLTGAHTQQLRFVLPNGDAYQTLESKFTTLASTNSESVQVATRSRGEPTVVNVLPVAGTHITQRSLTGAWTAEVLLDGKLVTRSTLILRPREQN